MRLIKVSALAVLVAALVAGAGYAAIPSASGVISACKIADGSLKLIDKENGESCAAGKQLVEWNVQGPAGPAGPQGPQGPTGPVGPPDTSAAGFLDQFGTDTGDATTAYGEPCTVGEIILSASRSKTAGGIPARGQLLQVVQNTALFAVLGNTYGGDGKWTFALPDLRSITPNSMTYSICAQGTMPG